jgi:hypothetical protein
VNLTHVIQSEVLYITDRDLPAQHVKPIQHKCTVTSDVIKKCRFVPFLFAFVDVGPRGCDAVWTCGRYQRFGGTYCPEDGGSILPETLASTYQSTRRHNPEYQHRHLHRRENLKFHFLLFITCAHNAQYCLLPYETPSCILALLVTSYRHAAIPI